MIRVGTRGPKLYDHFTQKRIQSKCGIFIQRSDSKTAVLTCVLILREGKQVSQQSLVSAALAFSMPQL